MVEDSRLLEYIVDVTTLVLRPQLRNALNVAVKETDETVVDVISNTILRIFRIKACRHQYCATHGLN